MDTLPTRIESWYISRILSWCYYCWTIFYSLTIKYIFARIKFVGHNLMFRTVAMFAISLQAVFHEKCEDVLTTWVLTKYHIPSCDVRQLSTPKGELKKIRTPAILLL
jgi:hypothetical protein